MGREEILANQGRREMRGGQGKMGPKGSLLQDQMLDRRGSQQGMVIQEGLAGSGQKGRQVSLDLWDCQGVKGLAGTLCLGCRVKRAHQGKLAYRAGRGGRGTRGKGGAWEALENLERKESREI